MTPPQLNLRLLLWLVACVALACWVLTLPPLLVEEERFTLSFLIDGSDPPPTFIATHWPLEVALRIGACIVPFFVPYLRVRGRNRPATH